MTKNSISENIEEYLEVFYRNGSNKEQVSTTTVSKELGIAPGSVTQMLKKLEGLGYIEYVPYKGAYLTDEGMKIAQKIIRKHRILETFLTEILKIKKENVHAQACEMEHTLSDEAERAICAMLNHPDLGPGNKVIPACDLNFNNCEQCAQEVDFDKIINRDSNLLSLSELHSSVKGVVCFIRGKADFLNHVTSLGINIGTEISFYYADDSDTVKIMVDDKDIDLPLEIANNIFIKI